MRSIVYKDGYKYWLCEDYYLSTDIKPSFNIDVPFISLDVDGILMIKKGYAWDGPSGPAIDTKNFMRGSLVHDVFYQLLRLGLIPAKYRKDADELLRKLCKEDGMSVIRAWWVYWSVRLAAGPAADADHEKQCLTAP